MLNTKLKLVVLSALLSLTAAANAGQYHFDKLYVGGGIGNSGMADESSTGLSIVIGTAYKYDASFLKDLDTRAEIGYLTTTESESTSGSFDITTSAAAIFGMQRLNYNVAQKFDVVAKIGFTLGTISTTTSSGVGAPVKSDTRKYSISYALGGEYSFDKHISAGFSYTNYTADINSLDATISYKF